MDGSRTRIALLVAALVVAASGLALQGWARDDGRVADPSPAPTSTVPIVPTVPTVPVAPPPPTALPPLVATDIVPSGQFVLAAGESGPVGGGPLRTYTIEVESGIPIDVAAFVAEADRILADPRGWTADGAVSLQRVADYTTASFRVVLATPATTDELCSPLRTAGRFSCFQDNIVVLNLARWLEGSEAAGLALPGYREYMVNHEVGHALGHPNVVCPAPGSIAPVMMQLTRRINACVPNQWPFP